MDKETQDKMTDALLEGMKQGYEASRSKALRWWERALWALLAGLAATASALFGG